MNEIKKKKSRGWFKGCLIIALLILVVIIGLPFGLYVKDKLRINKAERFVNTYLEQKYHKKFVVSNGKYIWATNSYTFDAYPTDDPELKFPVFIHKIFSHGVGDMYALLAESRKAEILIKSYVDAISNNNYYGASFGPGMYGGDKQWEVIKSDIRENALTPLQAAAKYPREVYLNTKIFYAFDVTDTNKEQIFKGVYNLIEFLKSKGFGYINIKMTFYPPKTFGGKTIKEAYKKDFGNFEEKYGPYWTYVLVIDSNDITDIKSYMDINRYIGKPGWQKPWKKPFKKSNITTR